MKVKLKTAFSILDGRLSTEMDEVYQMLNYIFDQNLMTHQLPTALRKLEEVSPKWFLDAKSVIEEIKHIEGTNDFARLMKAIDISYPNFEVELGKVDFYVPFSSGLIPSGK